MRAFPFFNQFALEGFLSPLTKEQALKGGQPMLDIETQRPLVRYKFEVIKGSYVGLPLNTLGPKLFKDAKLKGVTFDANNQPDPQQKVVCICSIVGNKDGAGRVWPKIQPMELMSRAYYEETWKTWTPVAEDDFGVAAKPVQAQPVVSKEVDLLLSPNPAATPAATTAEVPAGFYAVEDDLPF